MLKTRFFLLFFLNKGKKKNWQEQLGSVRNASFLLLFQPRGSPCSPSSPCSLFILSPCCPLPLVHPVHLVPPWSPCFLFCPLFPLLPSLPLVLPRFSCSPCSPFSPCFPCSHCYPCCPLFTLFPLFLLDLLGPPFPSCSPCYLCFPFLPVPLVPFSPPVFLVPLVLLFTLFLFVALLPWTWLGIPWLGLVSLCQIWDFYGYSLNTLKYPKMGIRYFFPW